MRHLTLGRVRPATWPSGRGVLGRYAAAWAYLAAFVLAELIDSALPARDQSLLLHWASTNVVNLHHHPVGALVVSADIAPTFAWAWPARAAAVLDLALLVFVGAIFNGLTALQVAPVGHVTAIVVSVPLGILLARRARRQPPPATAEPAVPDVRDPRR